MIRPLYSLEYSTSDRDGCVTEDCPNSIQMRTDRSSVQTDALSTECASASDKYKRAQRKEGWKQMSRLFAQSEFRADPFTPTGRGAGYTTRYGGWMGFRLIHFSTKCEGIPRGPFAPDLPLPPGLRFSRFSQYSLEPSFSTEKVVAEVYQKYGKGLKIHQLHYDLPSFLVPVLDGPWENVCWNRDQGEGRINVNFPHSSARLRGFPSSPSDIPDNFPARTGSEVCMLSN